jgi:hypothetical protein
LFLLAPVALMLATGMNYAQSAGAWPHGLPEQLGQQMGEPPTTEPAQQAFQPSDVEIILRPSRNFLVAGDLWSVEGEVRNHSKTQPIWIVNRSTTLMFPSEVYGATSTAIDSYAIFPAGAQITQITDSSQDVRYYSTVRIDPQGSYVFSWAPPSRMGNPTQFLPHAVNPLRDITEYAFLTPGDFWGVANVHVWYAAPSFHTNDVVNPISFENSFVTTQEQQFPIQASPWVLIAGGTLGGLLSVVLQMINGGIRPPERANPLHVLAWAVLAVGGAVLLAGVVAVLFARVAATDFFVAVKVNDVWGAIATGFIVALVGFGPVENWARRLAPRGAGGVSGNPADAGNQSAPEVRFEPPTASLAGVSADTAKLVVSAKGMPAEASEARIELQSERNGSRHVLTTRQTLSGGAFDKAELSVPKTVRVGAYRVVVTSNLGPYASSADLFDITSDSNGTGSNSDGGAKAHVLAQ